MKLIPLGITGTLISSCDRAYYGTLERFGIEKRDVLVDRVEEAKDSQQDAQKEFRSALEQYRSVVTFDGGELEDQYNALSDAYEDAKAQAEDVRDRIGSVRDVGDALFVEWKAELELYQNSKLKADSASRLQRTQTQFNGMVKAMERAANKMDPVLNVLRDQVLYLKHNLNARAIAALKAEKAQLEQRVDQLIKQMEEAIREAEKFINGLSEEQSA